MNCTTSPNTEYTSEDENEIKILSSYYSEDESDSEKETSNNSSTDDSEDDTPLNELIQSLQIKLEPVEQPVQLPDGTTIHNHTSSLQTSPDVKQEITDSYDLAGQNPEIYCFKCRICGDIFNTRYQFAVHIAKHDIQCLNCKCKYKTWKELKDHEVYCTRRFGRTLIPPREKRYAPKPKLKFKCCLCKR